MADTVRPSLRLRQNEQRMILLIGDLIASIGAVFGALYFWREYNSYVLLAKGFTDRQIDRLFLDSIKTAGMVLPFAAYLAIADGGAV
jgi:hypothetical protein